MHVTEMRRESVFRVFRGREIEDQNSPTVGGRFGFNVLFYYVCARVLIFYVCASNSYTHVHTYARHI